MLPKQGTIFIYDRDGNGNRHVIPVEETPDNLEELVKKKTAQNQSSRKYLKDIINGQADLPKPKIPKISSLRPNPFLRPCKSIPTSSQSKQPIIKDKNIPTFKTNESGHTPAKTDKSINKTQQLKSDIRKPSVTKYNHLKNKITDVSVNNTKFRTPNLNLINPTIKSKTKKQAGDNGRKHDLPSINLFNGHTRDHVKDLNEYPFLKTKIKEAKSKKQESERKDIVSRVSGFKASKVSKVSEVSRESRISKVSRASDVSDVSCKRKDSGKKSKFKSKLGIALLALALGGLVGPVSSTARLETLYNLNQAQKAIINYKDNKTPLPPSVPVMFQPLISHDGSIIEPVNRDFSLIVPKIGINAPILSNVNPVDEKEYNEALKKGIAHASTSMTPDKMGTVYLFSHSTNYDWFTKDLNAVFYHLKNLESGDLIVVYYNHIRHTYILREKRVVKPVKVSYLVPQEDKKTLILQTCWPPGSVAERLLLFADLIEETSDSI